MKYITLFVFSLVVSISQAQDWANLNRFKNDNQHLMKKAIETQRVVFMGNSITEGWKNKELTLLHIDGQRLHEFVGKVDESLGSRRLGLRFYKGLAAFTSL